MEDIKFRAYRGTKDHINTFVYFNNTEGQIVEGILKGKQEWYGEPRKRKYGLLILIQEQEELVVVPAAEVKVRVPFTTPKERRDSFKSLISTMNEEKSRYLELQSKIFQCYSEIDRQKVLLKEYQEESKKLDLILNNIKTNQDE